MISFTYNGIRFWIVGPPIFLLKGELNAISIRRTSQSFIVFFSKIVVFNNCAVHKRDTQRVAAFITHNCNVIIGYWTRYAVALATRAYSATNISPSMTFYKFWKCPTKTVVNPTITYRKRFPLVIRFGCKLWGSTDSFLYLMT